MVRTHWFPLCGVIHGSKTSGDMSDLYWLSDAQMARLEPYFPKSHGKPRVDDRRVLSGISRGGPGNSTSLPPC